MANAEVSRENTQLFFVTAVAGILDLRSGELTYCNAGQENPWLLRPGVAGATVLDEGGGPPLCAIDDFAYRDARFQMRAGDLLCLVTDGVTEAQNAAANLYGNARLHLLLARLPAETITPQEVIDAIRADLAAFVGKAEQSDDLTLLVLRWNGPRAKAN